MHKTVPVISITNLKGGVGKTTLCFHFAYLFHQKNKNVLVIDLDPQGNLTSCFLDDIPEKRHHVKLLFEKDFPEPLEIRERLYLITSDIELSKYELQVKFESYFRLKNFLAISDIIKKYDVILIDTPPSLNIFTSNALIASSYVLCVLDPGEFAISGFEEVKSLVKSINEGMNLKIRLLGPVFNMVKRKTINFRRIFEKCKNLYGEDVFRNFIRYSTIVRNSTESKMTVFEFSPRHEIVGDFQNVFNEFLERTEITCSSSMTESRFDDLK